MKENEQDIEKENCPIDAKLSRKIGPASRDSFDLINLIGFPQSVQEMNSLQERFGISFEEFLEPTKETLEKVRDHLKKQKTK